MSSGAHILIVDDNPPVTQTLADILTFKSYDVYTAYSGKEAIAILNQHPVDVMITDVKMPDMNGVELYLQTRESNPALITFLMTAYAADDIIDKGLGKGIRTVLSKPIDVDFLLMMISAALGE